MQDCKVKPFFFAPAEPQNEDVEVIEVGAGDFIIEVCIDKQEVTISDGDDSIWFTSDNLVPLVLALLKLTVEKGWHGDIEKLILEDGDHANI